MPIRLVKENGDTISLDATSVDIVVERSQSNFGIPFFDAKKIGIDLNQAAVAFEIQGVLADDVGQEASAKATASIDLDQPQALNTGPQLIGGGGNPGLITSGFASIGTTQNSSVAAGQGAIGGIGSSGGSSGIGSAPTVVVMPTLGNKILDKWSGKSIDLPVAYWTERAAELDHPVKTGLQMWLNANILDDTLVHGDSVASWGDTSGNARHVLQSNSNYQPTFFKEGANGHSYVNFKSPLTHYLSYAYDSSNSPFLNPDELTIFVVSSRNSDAAGGVLMSRNGNDGYAIRYNSSSDSIDILSHNASGSAGVSNTGANSVGSGLTLTYPNVLTVRTTDTGDGDTLWDTIKLRINGEPKLPSTGSKTYSKNTSGALDIGRVTQGGVTNYLNGNIYEILIYNRQLTFDEVEKIEGYLSRKYNIALPSNHKYDSGYSYANKHIRFVFDKEMIASAKEPYGFFNMHRSTGLVIASGGVSGGTLTVEGSPGYGAEGVAEQPQSWFEVTETGRDYYVVFYNPTTDQFRGGNFWSMLKGKVTSVSATEIVVEYNITGSSDPPQDSDEIYIVPFNYDEGGMFSNTTKPVVVIPIKNADTFDEDALPDKAIGPDFTSNYQNGSARDGASHTRTDEYIAFLMKGAMTAEYLQGMEAVNTTGNTGMDKVFDVVITTGKNGNQTKLNITQQYATSLGALSNTIVNTMPEGIMPEIHGFTGGRAGKKVKSGGDKVQDIFGILGNSNNFGLPERGGVVERAHALGGGFFQEHMYRGTPETKGDYIEGIQIPYNSKATFGQSTFDTDIAQRNFFLTTDENVAGKLATINSVHANRAFSSNVDGHLKNGIKGMVMDFNVQRDAEMKAYEFSLKFVAADIIL